MALVLREMSTTYGRSPGGYLWAILEPAAGIALLTMIFSIGFRAPSLGSSFPLFYATGMLPFMLYMDVQGKLTTSLQFSRALLDYPRLSFMDALIARFLLNTLTQLLVGYLLFTLILTFFDARAVLDFGAIVSAYVMAIALAFGVGIMNCFLVTQFPIWQRIWAILNRPMFLISCIFFLFESVPEPYRGVLWFNPLIHIVGRMREGFYPFYQADYVSGAYVMGLSLGLAALGTLLLYRHHRDLLDR